MYIEIFTFSVSAWVFPEVSILYVEKTKEVEVCWGILYPPANHADEVQKGKGGGGGLESLLYCCCSCDCLGDLGDYFSGYV